MTDHKYTECSSCFKDLNEYELLDPCDIDGRIFCDKCASEFIAFRCGTLRDVSDMTHELRIANAPTVHYDMEPIHMVMHEAIENLNKLKS